MDGVCDWVPATLPNETVRQRISALHPDIRSIGVEAQEIDPTCACREELLYSRIDATAPFVAQLQVTMEHHLACSTRIRCPALHRRWTLRNARA